MIEYGDYKCDGYKTLSGLNDPLVQEWLRQVKELDWTGYELWIYGGILEWETIDLDGSIMGPLDTQRVNYLLDNITRISFELGVASGVVYNISNKLFNFTKIIKTDTKIFIDCAFYRGSASVDGKVHHFAELKDGLYQTRVAYPKRKHVKKVKEGHIYKLPVKVI